jgi:hypothetical protein
MLAPLERNEIAALESCLRRCIAALESDVDAAEPVDDAPPSPPRRPRAGKRPASRAEAS